MEIEMQTSLFENLIQKMLENHSPRCIFEGVALHLGPLGDGIRLREAFAFAFGATQPIPHLRQLTRQISVYYTKYLV